MKFIIEVDLSGDLDSTNNFKELVGPFLQDVVDHIPRNRLVSECLRSPGAVTYEGGTKAIVISNALQGPEGGTLDQAKIIIQAIVTTAPFEGIDRKIDAHTSIHGQDVELEVVQRHD